MVKTSDNYFFSKTNSRNSTVYYECSERKKSKCPVRIIIKENVITNITGEHNHTAEFRNVVKIKEAEIMESNLQENNRKIISEVYNTLKKDKLEPFMSSTKQLRMRCNRLRKKDLPVMDKNFKIPEKYKHIDTEPFLRFDSEISDGKRIIIFATNSGIQSLIESEEQHGDGTYDTWPKQYYQLYTVFAKVRASHHLIPCIFSLLPSKTTEVYEVLLKEILKLTKGALPKVFMIDFELGMLKALNNVFVGVEVKGCYFHWKQAIFRKMQKSNILNAYNTNAQFQEGVKKLYALVCVPEGYVAEVFSSITIWFQEHCNIPEATSLLQYFEKTWTGKCSRGRVVKDPILPPKLWNHFKGILDGEILTNNSVECWNREWKNSLPRKPSVWDVLDAFCVEVANSDLRRKEILKKITIDSRKPNSLHRNESLKELMQSFKRSKIEEFLNAIVQFF